jgi:luciferase family oxidoreductase group 1
MVSTIPLSVLDLAIVGRDESVANSLAGCVRMAQRAEALGYSRVWYAEHHNMSSIASSATAVLIAHVAAHTTTIRLGSGGVMLPNHAPLVVAEQFGTLATLHPGRIDLGLGRAPGTDQVTLRALRRDPMAADSFPQDVLELQGYLADETRVPTIHATPGRGTHVPIYILGSSLFGAQLAGMLGLPYAFASHFAPTALEAALRMYRSEFRPSEQLAEPYAIAAVNVIAAPTREEADRQRVMRRRALGRRMLTRGGQQLDDAQIDAILDSPDGSFVDEMMTYTACGIPEDVRAYLEDFQRLTGAEELMTVHQGGVVDDRILSLTLTAKVMDLGE